MTEVSLFVPCYVDQLAPRVAWATVRILEHLGLRVRFDTAQTCCGQPFLNTGAARDAKRLARRHLAVFDGADTIVCPSASCVATIRHRFGELGAGEDELGKRQRGRTFELAEYLFEEQGNPRLGSHFPHRVALLQSCHGLRDLGLGRGSEAGPDADEGRSILEAVLGGVDGLELCAPERPDECCGFGGAFSVKFPEVSTRIGNARMLDFAATGAEYVTGTDVSCLLQLEGIRARTGNGPRPIHLAEILAAGLSP